MKWLPHIETRTADAYNAFAWSLEWGPLTLWTIEHVTLGTEIDCGVNGFNIFVRVPYLVIKVTLLPEMEFLNKLSRKCDPSNTETDF